MTNTNKLTKENMMNELNEYGYNEENLYEIINWYYELEEEFGISALNKDGVNLGMEIIKTKYLESTGLQ